MAEQPRCTVRIRMKVYGGLDAVMRVVNLARRAKLRFHRFDAEFEEPGSRYAEVRIAACGSEKEARWLVAKLDRLPEVLEIGADYERLS